MAIDEARVESLVGQMAGHMTGGGVCLGIDVTVLGLDGSPLRHLTLDPSVDYQRTL